MKPSIASTRLRISTGGSVLIGLRSSGVRLAISCSMRARGFSARRTAKPVASSASALMIAMTPSAFSVRSRASASRACVVCAITIVAQPPASGSSKRRDSVAIRTGWPW